MTQSIDLEPFRRFVELNNELREIRAREKELATQVDEMALALPSILIENGVQSLPLDGFTLYPADTGWASPKEGSDYEEISQVLINEGYGSLVRIGSRQLNTLWNDLADDEGAVPEWLSGVAEKAPRIKLRMRKQPKKKA